MFRDLLPNMDRHNLDYYSELDADQKKGFAGVVAMRFMSQASGRDADKYLIETNKRANVHFFDMYEHPELQYKLLASSGSGQRVSHAWIGNAKNPSNALLYDFILRYWSHVNSMEVETVLGQFDKASFSEFVDGTGIETNEAKRIKKSFEARGV